MDVIYFQVRRYKRAGLFAVFIGLGVISGGVMNYVREYGKAFGLSRIIAVVTSLSLFFALDQIDYRNPFDILVLARSQLDSRLGALHKASVNGSFLGVQAPEVEKGPEKFLNNNKEGLPQKPVISLRFAELTEAAGWDVSRHDLLYKVLKTTLAQGEIFDVQSTTSEKHSDLFSKSDPDFIISPKSLSYIGEPDTENQNLAKNEWVQAGVKLRFEAEIRDREGQLVSIIEISETSYSHDVKVKNTTPRTQELLLARVAKKIRHELMHLAFPMKIVKVSGRDIYVSRRSENSIMLGETLDVYRTGTTKGATFSTVERMKVGQLKVTYLHRNYIVAKVLPSNTYAMVPDYEVRKIWK